MKPLNQFLCEDVMGMCWHEWESINNRVYGSAAEDCIKCHNAPRGYGLPIRENPDFTQPDWWWKLWEFARNQEDWDKFLFYIAINELHFSIRQSPAILKVVAYEYLTRNRDNFPSAYAHWKGWKGE